MRQEELKNKEEALNLFVFKTLNQNSKVTTLMHIIYFQKFKSQLEKYKGNDGIKLFIEEMKQTPLTKGISETKFWSFKDVDILERGFKELE